jgi:DNA-binding transcriptional ArsR family regulator
VGLEEDTMATKRRSSRAPARAHGRLALQDLAQVRALSHPLRLRLLEVFGEKPRTTKQAAELLRQPPTRLYHHVAALERAGLVRLRETRPNRGTVEKYYEIAARQFEVASAAARSPASASRPRTAIGLTLFEQARQDLVGALTGTQADHDAVFAARGIVALTPAGARDLQKKLRHLFEEMGRKASARGPSRKRYSLTFAVIPMRVEPGD